MSTEKQALSIMDHEGQAANADCSSQIVIIVSPDAKPGRYRAYVETEQEPLRVSRQPFFDGARKLLARGYDPRTVLVMRWAGANDWTLRASLRVAAKLTVDEHDGVRFAKWKPFWRSAGRPRNAISTAKVSKERAAETATPDGTAEEGGGDVPPADQIRPGVLS